MKNIKVLNQGDLKRYELDSPKMVNYNASKVNSTYAYQTLCEIIVRVPLISFLYPILLFKPISKVGIIIYEKLFLNNVKK